jgi:hypothetical protein
MFPKQELVPLSIHPSDEAPVFAGDFKFFDSTEPEAHNHAVVCFGLHSLVVQQLELDQRIHRFASAYISCCHQVKKSMNNILHFLHTMNVIEDLIICDTFNRLQKMREKFEDVVQKAQESKEEAIY